MGSGRAFLDTTVQIDYNKTAARRRQLDDLLGQFEWKYGTSISQLEFKKTILQECITIHNRLAERKRFTSARDELLESNHPQAKLRSHIFNNLLNIWASSFQITPDEDRKLAERARIDLELIIPELYDAFAGLVDSVLTGRIGCTRASERPFKKSVAFDNSMPNCSRAKNNKRCRVEDAIRQHAPAIIAAITPQLNEDDVQLRRTIGLFQQVISDAQADLSHNQCRSCGDALMAIEAQGIATHAVSSNAKEWERLSSATGMQFVKTEFPPEKVDET